MAVNTVRPIHWREPSIIIGSWVLGLALCIGHFFFYRSLDGTEPGGGGHIIGGFEYTSQQLNIALGTTFAFMVKSAFVLASCTSFYQAFWKMARQQSAAGARSPTLGHLDALYAALHNLMSLFRFPLWLRQPFLLLMAFAIWLLPIPSLITPATLSVALKGTSQVSLENVPTVDFATLNFMSELKPGFEFGPGFRQWDYTGPSQLLNKLAFAVAAEGNVVPIKPPYTNSTWQLQFLGPSLRCSKMESPESNILKHDLGNFTQALLYNHAVMPVYFSWLTAPDSLPANPAPQPKSLRLAQSWTFDDGMSLLSASPTPLLYAPEIILNFGIFPYGANSQSAYYIPGMTQQEYQNYLSTSTVVQCRPFNATYITKLDYVNGVQRITTKISEFHQPMSVITAKPHDNGVLTYYLNTIYTIPAAESCLSFSLVESLSPNSTCPWNPLVIQKLSFQAIFEAFANLFVGIITTTEPNNFTAPSQVPNTALLRTNELQFMSNYQFDERQGRSGDLQAYLWASNSTKAQTISGMRRLQRTKVASNQSLVEGVEQMFTNFVVSLMSESAFRPETVPSIPLPEAEVTSFTYKNIYVFAIAPFIAAYVASAVLSLAAVAVGIFAIFTTRSTYSYDFSTVLRVSREAELSEEIKEADLDGRSPLPNYLDRATLSLR